MANLKLLLFQFDFNIQVMMEEDLSSLNYLYHGKKPFVFLRLAPRSIGPPSSISYYFTSTNVAGCRVGCHFVVLVNITIMKSYQSLISLMKSIKYWLNLEFTRVIMFQV